MTNHFSTVLRGLRFGGRSGRIRRPAREMPGSEEGWTLLALGLATLIALGDGLANDQIVLVVLLALPPILTSATAGARATMLVAGYAIALALLALFWHQLSFSGFMPRLLVVVAAGALSVWNATLRERLTASARGGALLAEGMSMLDDALEEQVLLDELVKLPVPELCGLAIVDLIADDDSIGAAAVASTDETTTRSIKSARRNRRISPSDDHPVAEVIRTGEPKLFKHMGDPAMREIAIDDEHLEVVRASRPRSVLIVPLRAHGETIGSLMLASFDDDDRFGADEIGFAEDLARRATTGVMNARLHDTQARFADALQRALLPRALPAVEGLEIASRFRPVGVGAQIGGDFYDLFRLGASSWGAVIGDVCGKGPEAAALTSMMRDTLRASALRGESPRETLSLLNAAMLEAELDGRFCTASYARFDLNSHARLTVCNGGHPPPLIMRKGGDVERLGGSGTLLGIYADPHLEDNSVALAEGDLVMLYTDGLYDVRPGSLDTAQSLEEVLASCKGMSAEETATTIEKSVIGSQRGSQQDDQAILVLRRV